MEAIHRERFPLTPTVIYAEMFKNAQVLLQRQGADAFRRSARLALVEEEEEETSQEEPDAPHPGLKPLRFKDQTGLDLEVFKLKPASKPPGWNRAVAQASEIHTVPRLERPKAPSALRTARPRSALELRLRSTL